MLRPGMDDFRIDESRWPLVVVTYPPLVTLEKYRALFKQYVDLSRRGTKIGYLIDMRRFNPLLASASQRKLAAATFTEHREELVRATICEGRVVASSFTSGVLTAFDWLTGQKWPCANFTTKDEAEPWVVGRMRAIGVPPGTYA